MRFAVVFREGFSLQVMTEDAFVEGARRFGERHRKFRLHDRKVAHHPVVEGVTQFVGLLQNRRDRSRVGGEDTRNAEFVEARVKGSADLLFRGLCVDPAVFEHRVEEAREFGRDRAENLLDDRDPFGIGNGGSLLLCWRRADEERGVLRRFLELAFEHAKNYEAAAREYA